jgi:SAM-dependent methyltransferase
VTTDVRTAYEAAGVGWGDGPSRVYGRLALPLLDAVDDVGGTHVLDVGTGAGLVARALAARGAHVVATDLAHSMLATGRDSRPPGVVGDLRDLPFVDAAFDLVTAAFVLNHLADPEPGLRELYRVTRPAGALLATTFDGLPKHPAKGVVDAVAARFGFVAPAWYDGMRRDSCQASSPEVLTRAAVAAGWRPVVERLDVRVDDLTPVDLAGWRLGMAHLAGFVTGLSPEKRGELLDAAAAELHGVEPLVLPVLLLRATRADPQG